MKILVLVHRHDQLEAGSYMLPHLSKEWTLRGHIVEYLHGVEETLPDADVAILHVDLTTVPDDYVEAVQRYPLVINRFVTDVSKARFSRSIIGPDDPWTGPVIVKTSANYGGLPEMRLTMQSEPNRSRRYVQLPWYQRKWLRRYRVFRSTDRMPDEVWQNENLVVEKFQPERNDEGHFCLRVWIFFGDREIYYRSIATHHLIKSQNTIRRDMLPVAEVPEEIRQAREELRFDYGKFDFGICERGTVLYDVNKTPGIPRYLGKKPETAAQLRGLSEGIKMYVQRSR